MSKATISWDKYINDPKNIKSLLNAYKHVEIAREEFKYAKDKEGIDLAKSRIKLIKRELESKLGK